MIDLILFIVSLSMEDRTDACAYLAMQGERTVIEGNLYTARDYYYMICDDAAVQHYMLEIKRGY